MRRKQEAVTLKEFTDGLSQILQHLLERERAGESVDTDFKRRLMIVLANYA